MLYLITGGSGSGKSEYAEKIAVNCHKLAGGSLFYLATMRVWDDEGQKRVERHRKMRSSKGFETIECPTDISSVIFHSYTKNESPNYTKSKKQPVILLECMSNLVLNEFYAKEAKAKERILFGTKHLQNQCQDLIIVTNEIFSDGTSYDPESERYIKLLGQVNQELGMLADSVTEVVYGIPISISERSKKVLITT